MPGKSEIMRAVREGLCNLEVVKPWTDTEGSKAVKTKLCEIGREFEFKVGAKRNEVEKAYRDFGEWLYDVTWARIRAKCRQVFAGLQFGPISSSVATARRQAFAAAERRDALFPARSHTRRIRSRRHPYYASQFTSRRPRSQTMSVAMPCSTRCAICR